MSYNHDSKHTDKKIKAQEVRQTVQGGPAAGVMPDNLARVHAFNHFIIFS